MLRLSFISILTFWLMHTTRAQGEGAVQLKFEKDTIELIAGETFSNKITISNTSGAAIKIDSLTAANNYPGIVFIPEYKELLPAGTQRSLMLRMIANAALLNSSYTTLEYVVHYTFNNLAYKQVARFNIKRPFNNYIAIGIQGNEAYFNPAISENPINFYIQNPGYTARNIILKLELLPAGQLTLDQQQIIVMLAPGEKKYLSVRLKKRGNINYYSDYSLQISALEPGSAIPISGVSILVRSLSNRKSLLSNQMSDMNKNFAEIAASRSNLGNDFIKVRANVEKKIAAQKNLTFNTTVDYFTQYNFLNLYDTRLVINTPKNEYALGNIYSTGYDINLSGRGAKFIHKTGNRSAVEVLGAQNNFLLYSSASQALDPGFAIGSKYMRVTRRGLPLSVAYMFTQNAFNNTDAHIISTQVPVYSDSSQKIQMETGLSSEQFRTTRENNSGAAVGLSYELTKKTFSFYSSNYYSSPYYAGLRRGLANFYETVRFQLSHNKSLSFNYSASLNNPKSYFTDSSFSPGSIYNNNQFTNHQAEIGFSYQVNNYTLSVIPNYNYQKYPSLWANAYNAYRLRFAVSKLMSRHSLGLSTDYGIAKFSNDATQFQNARLALNYSFAGIYIDAIADLNPFNIYSVVQGTTTGYKNYTVSAGYNIIPGKTRLSGNLYAGYTYITAPNNQSIFSNINLNYKVSSSWYVIALGSYSRFENKLPGFTNNFDNLQFSIGIKYHFDHIVSNKNNNVTLDFFEDIDKNGERSKGDLPMAGIIVSLNANVFATTDGQGKLKLNNIPDGKYKIAALKNNIPLNLSNEDSIFINKNGRFSIPVTKTYPVTGILTEIKEQYNIQEPDIMGITVYARNIATLTTVTTVTDFNGGFNFQLPEGIYDVYIENNRYEFTNNRQRITVGKNKATETLQFNFKNKEVKINVKQF